MSNACESCAYFDSDRSNGGSSSKGEGLCRFNPPVSQPNAESHGLWPVVGKADWCGHFSTESQVRA